MEIINKNMNEVKKNIVEALRFHIAGMQEDGDIIPAPLNGEWVPQFELTARAELKAAEAFITRNSFATMPQVLKSRALP